MPDLQLGLVTVIAQCLTAVSLAVAAGVALWKFVFEERRRMPAINGDIKVTVFRANEQNIYAQIDCVWNNKGPLPIHLNRDKSIICITDLNPVGETRAISPIEGNHEELEKDAFYIYPIRQTQGFMLEPGTKSRIQTGVELKKDHLYQVTCRIEIIKTHTWLRNLPERDFWWIRRKIFRADEKTLTTKTDLST